METISADQWCDVVLKEYDEAFELLRYPVNGKEESTLLKSARQRRAQMKLATATIKADVAMFVMQLIRDASRGTIIIDVPEAQLDIKLVWNK